MSKSYNHVPYSLVEKLFVIDSSSKTGIAWKKNSRSAGTVLPSGYCQVRMPVKDKNLFVHTHRIVWMLANKKDIPDCTFHVDHIDFDRTNNSPENLRLIKSYWNTIRRTCGKADGLPSNIYKTRRGYVAHFVYEGQSFKEDCSSIEQAQDWLNKTRTEVAGEMVAY